MKNLFKALAEFQNEVPVIHEETKGYNYTYSNINSIFKVIKPLLKKHKLSFTQLLDDDKLKTILFHSESGESLESSVIMPIIDLKGMNKYQSTGSAITYFRRYSLACILGLITDKDLDACGDVDSEKTLNSCKDLDELKGVYSKLSKADQAKYASLKDELKLKLK